MQNKWQGSPMGIRPPAKSPGKFSAPGSGGKESSKMSMSSGLSLQRKSLRLVGAAVLLGALVWTVCWQIAVVPALHSPGHSIAFKLRLLITYLLWRPEPPDAEDEADLRALELHRDPCPQAEHQFPALDFVPVTLKAMAWAPIRNRWQKEMDACKCVPSASVRSEHNEFQGLYDVKRFGAVGDGKTDDSLAFRLAFHAACVYATRERSRGTVLVPRTCFYVRALDFHGPCGPGVRFQIDGTILGPLEPSSYPPAEFTSHFFPFTNGLLTFRDFEGLILEGSGVVDGQGFVFWERFRQKTLGLPIRPFAIRLMSCVDTTVRGITLRNSPMYHLFAYHCRGLSVSWITTHSPGNSPNTDSMKLVGVEDCHIANCRLHGGDDDVSIVAVEGLVARNVTIENIRATSGHGISIGSVGWNGTVACVSDVLVRNVTLKELTHGVRIKSWRGGQGIVRNIRYEDIRFKDTARAIALNQFYCDSHQNWTCGDHPNNVVFYNISYSNLTGTVNAAKHSSGIDIKCSATVPCTRISLEGIHLTPSKSSPRSSITTLTPIIDNIRESVAVDVGVLKASSPSWAGALTEEQEEKIKFMAAKCGIKDLDLKLSREPGNEPGDGQGGSIAGEIPQKRRRLLFTGVDSEPHDS